jgi:hypothetical protein
MCSDSGARRPSRLTYRFEVALRGLDVMVWRLSMWDGIEAYRVPAVGPFTDTLQAQAAADRYNAEEHPK